MGIGHLLICSSLVREGGEKSVLVALLSEFPGLRASQRLLGFRSPSDSLLWTAPSEFSAFTHGPTIFQLFNSTRELFKQVSEGRNFQNFYSDKTRDIHGCGYSRCGKAKSGAWQRKVLTSCFMPDFGCACPPPPPPRVFSSNVSCREMSCLPIPSVRFAGAYQSKKMKY